MPFIPSPRTVVAAAGLSAVVLGSTGTGLSGASTRAASAAAKPPQIVTATRVRRSQGTLASGTPVASAVVAGQRVFTDAKHGFALASVSDADYPVATTDGGKTWRTNGPALHLHAAQAPLALVFVGAVNRMTLFAWGGGQVIDTTRDGGKTWYRALFSNGSPIAVVQNLNGHLLGFVGSFSGASTWQYLSKDGGRTWHYQATVGR